MQYLKILKNSGLKATPQRLCLLRRLGSHTHPSIDELYEMIKEDYPSISLATIYKNLSLLMEQNLVIEVNSPGQKPRYDIFEHPHIHIACNHCGHINDISGDTAQMASYQLLIENAFGSPLSHLNIVATARSCPNCKK